MLFQGGKGEGGESNGRSGRDKMTRPGVRTRTESGNQP